MSLNDIKEYESQGLIDNTRNLRNQKLYIYAGARSAVFDLGKFEKRHSICTREQ